MKNKALLYTASLLCTAAVVASSVFLPRALLDRQERVRLGAETVLINGSYHSRQHPRPTPVPTASPEPTSTVAPSPTAPSNWLEEELLKKVRMMEDPGNRTIQRQPGEGDMTMKKAVDLCIKQLENLVKSNAILPLPNFPGDYTMNASLNTVFSTNDGEEFHYWSISFGTNTERTKNQAGIGLIMDAETGSVLQFKMHSDSLEINGFLLTDALKSIASGLGMTGKVMKLPDRESGQQTAVWVSYDKKLFLTMYMTQDHQQGTLALVIDTHLPDQ